MSKGLTKPPAIAAAQGLRMSRLLVKVIVLWIAVLFLGIGGTAGYAVYCWKKAQKEVAEYKIDEARQHLRFLLFLRPNHVPTRLLAARAARLDGDFEEAEMHLGKCLKLTKESTEEIQVEYLLMRVQRGEEDEVARELLRYVDKGYVESKLILDTLAQAYMRNLRSGMAFTCLSMRIELGPDDAEPYEWRGWVLERLNDWGGAIKDYTKSLEIDPDRATARLRLAELQLEHTTIPEATENLELLYRRFPDRADIQARLGQCRLAQGHDDDARPLLESALKEMPDDPQLLLDLSKLEMRDNNWSLAEKRLRHALQLNPADVVARFNLIACLDNTGRRQEADAERDRHKKDSALLNRVTKILQSDAEHPIRDPDALFEVASTFMDMGNTRVGLWWLNRVLQLNPRHAGAHKRLAEYYEGKGNKDMAAQHRRQIPPRN
jgi:tetratricopeptide (TPR) repeat protein